MRRGRGRALLASLVLAGAATGVAHGMEKLVYTEPLRMTGQAVAQGTERAARPFPPARPGGALPVQVPALRMTGRGGR